MQTPNYLSLSQEYEGTKNYEFAIRELRNIVNVSVSEDRVLVRLHNIVEEHPNEMSAYASVETFLKSLHTKMSSVIENTPEPKKTPSKTTRRKGK